MLRRVLSESLLTLLVLAVVWWLLRSGEWLTDERLARVKPGMTLAEVTKFLGSPQLETNPVGTSVGTGTLLATGGPGTTIMLETRGITWTWVTEPGPDFHPLSYCSQFYFNPKDVWTPKYVASPPRELTRMCLGFDRRRNCFWLGRERMLWLTVDEQGQVTDVGVTPLRREGGGLAGWLTSQYDSWKRPRPAATVVWTGSVGPTSK